MKKLLAHHHKAAELIVLHGMSTKDVAEELEMSIQSVQEWQRAPMFVELMESIRRDIIENTLDLAVRESPKSLKKLIQIRDDPDSKPCDAMRAADMIMKAGLNSRKIQELEHEVKRLTALARMRRNVPVISFTPEAGGTPTNGVPTGEEGPALVEVAPGGPDQSTEPGGFEAGPLAGRCLEDWTDPNPDELFETER
jgi:hypothetical protein